MAFTPARGRTAVSVWVIMFLGMGGAAFAAGGPRQYLKRSADWFAGPDAKRVAANILSYQSDLGGWPKNIDTTAAPYTGDRKDLRPTFDNDATTDELRFLARIYDATQDDRYRRAFEKGMDYILKAQYPSGGWPQFYPPDDKYHRYITFNDNAMVRLLEFLRETYTSDVYRFVDADRRGAARRAFDRGIDCILKCQVRVDGKLTAWCAQHDEVNYQPRPGRSYELVSLSGSESVGIVRLLMSLDNPSPEVVRAVEGAVAWFESAKLKGIRQVVRRDERAPRGRDKVVVQDPNAPPMWARFYEIGTNRPIFADRDGVAKHELAAIGYERRNGYAWLGYWPQPLLEKEYPAWKQRLAKAERAPLRIVLVGDSTVVDNGGWGAAFARLLDPGAVCINEAKSGRSSKSFVNEGHWKKALEKKPDYVLIQFGHNDMPGKGPGRETDPKTTYREYLIRYIEDARAAGAKPILVTPMTRRLFTKEGKIRSNLVDYAEAVKEVARAKKVPLVDLHARSIEALDRMGPQAAAALDMASKDPAKPDRTHLSPKGSDVMAALVAEEVKKAVPELGKHLK